jgi:hypothetical protein
MFTNKFALLVTFFSIFTIQASLELEELIVKTDIDAVKKILPTVTFNLEAKQHLVDLANDTMLMRLKMLEIYSFREMRDTSAQSVEHLKKFLSKKTINDIKDLETRIGRWAGASLLSAITTCISALYVEPHFSGELVSKIALSSLIASAVVYFISLCNIVNDNNTLQSAVRTNLQQLYYDSIQIKALIAKKTATLANANASISNAASI